MTQHGHWATPKGSVDWFGSGRLAGNREKKWIQLLEF